MRIAPATPLCPDPTLDLQPAFASLLDATAANDPDAPLPPSFAADDPLFSGGPRLVASARRLADGDRGRGCLGREGAYRSVNPRISGQYAGSPKCNVFAGDVLFAAGYEAPTYRLPGGGGHYKEAERWPRETSLFDKITDLGEVRRGDLLVVDDLARRGPGGAHLELITDVAIARGEIVTIGARTAGVAEDGRYGRRLLQAQPAGDHFAVRGRASCDIYVLRPRPDIRLALDGPRP
jgi:hypothetical protein